jgi:low affinity Fe/Cu permease
MTNHEDDETGVHMDYKTLDERFTNFADIISEMMGKWWVTAIALILVLVWALIGPSMNYSDSWQLWVNTPTTIAELFIGFLIAAAANRVERRHEQLLREIKTHTQVDLFTTREDVKTTERAERATRQVETDIRQLSDDMQSIKRMLAKVVTE